MSATKSWASLAYWLAIFLAALPLLAIYPASWVIARYAEALSKAVEFGERLFNVE